MIECATINFSFNLVILDGFVRIQTVRERIKQCGLFKSVNDENADAIQNQMTKKFIYVVMFSGMYDITPWKSFAEWIDKSESWNTRLDEKKPLYNILC